MNRHTDIKQKVLQGVYEDNAGIPRTFRGKRKPREIPVPQPANHYRLIIAALLGVVAVLGFSFRMAAWNGTDPTAVPPGINVAGTALSPSLPLLLGAGETATFFSEHMDGSQPLPSAMQAAASSVHYESMLEQLGMPMADLFDLTIQTIVIDPGHGGIDPGATGRGGLKEKDVVLDIAKRLRNKLARTGKYRVLLTHEGDRKMFLKERVAFAKDNRADLFVSIHINSLPPGAERLNYTETYYFGPHTDNRSLELAEAENHDSDYFMGDFREVIARIGDTLKTEESQELARSIHTSLFGNLRRHNPSLMDARAKTAPFVVLLGVEVPSVLVEVSCISNPAEEKRLSTPGYRDDIADYMEAGIIDYLEQRANRNHDRGRAEHVAKQES